ncbi:c-type cytochrome [Deinococcus sp.]|uniref:c-type cytochrome n=1 Tax=Deinococcus sp. TaxID=47478 RepID=UPI003C7C0D95
MGNRIKVQLRTGAAFGVLFAVLGTGALLSAGVLAQTAPATPPPAQKPPPQGAMPNLNPATLPPGNAADGEALSATCAGCHGAAGLSSKPEFPRLAGQQPSYLSVQLLLYRAGIRKNEIMNKVAARLSDQNVSDLAAYFGGQAAGAAWSGQNPALAKEGAKLFALGSPERGVIACQVCHGTQGRGVNELGVALIRHQSSEYSTDVMHEFQKLGTTGSPQSTAMYLEMKPLSDHELEALSAYLAVMP